MDARFKNCRTHARGVPFYHLTRTAYPALVVRDQCIGVAPENQERVFNQFERAVSGRHYGGIGLGLWIVKRIVEGMGGTIELMSNIGHGSSFTVRLP